MNDREPEDLEALFERALVTSDEAYLVAESELRAAEGAAEVVAHHLQDADPVGRLLARVILDSEEAAGTDFDGALEYLDYMGRRFSRTLALNPPIPAVVDTLSRRYGGRLAEFLSLRLVQERQPGWRVMASLSYLDRHKSPVTNDALIRFAVQTPVPRFQQVAARVLADSGDPALGQKLAAARERLRGQGASLPAALASLANQPGAIA